VGGLPKASSKLTRRPFPLSLTGEGGAIFSVGELDLAMFRILRLVDATQQGSCGGRETKQLWRGRGRERKRVEWKSKE